MQQHGCLGVGRALNPNVPSKLRFWGGGVLPFGCLLTCMPVSDSFLLNLAGKGRGADDAGVSVIGWNASLDFKCCCYCCC